MKPLLERGRSLYGRLRTRNWGTHTIQPVQTMFRSAIFKLTAAYVVIIESITIVFSVIFYHFAVVELQHGFSNQYDRWYALYESLGLRTPGTPLAELNARAAHLYGMLVWLNLIILVVTTVIAYFFAKQTLRPIEAAHEQQRRFTADVSHELRTPLTALKMETEVSLLDPSAKADDLRAVLQSNLDEIQHMESLINNLLLLGSAEAGKLRTDFQEIDIADIVTSATRTTARLAESKQITLTQHLAHRLVTGDRASLVQLLVILIENALKYSPAHTKVAVRVAVRHGRVRVSVEDQGQGIAAEALPHVFDRFYRADEARSRDQSAIKAGGFGLGLSLAKLIADLHDAEIIISSAPNAGTKATVILAQNYSVWSKLDRASSETQ